MNDSMHCGMVNDFVDGELRRDECAAFEEHLIRCPFCQHEIETLLALQYKVVALPRAIQPRRDLWPNIASSLRAESVPMAINVDRGKNGKAVSPSHDRSPRWNGWYLRVAASVAVLLAGGAVWFVLVVHQRPTMSSVGDRELSPVELNSPLQDVGAHPSPGKNLRAESGPVTKNPSVRGRKEQQQTIMKAVHAPVADEAPANGEEIDLQLRLKRGVQLSPTSVVPSSAGKVLGFVSDQRGKPVPGITVEIASIHRSAITDDKGKFEFFGLLPDAYTFQVYGLGYDRNSVSGVKIIPGFTTQINFRLRSGSDALAGIAVNKEQLFAEVETPSSLEEIPLATYVRPLMHSNRLKVEGKVVDERGRSIVGAVVLVLGTKRGAYSDNEGRFHIYGVPPGSYTLQATASGFEPRDTTGVRVFSDFPVELNIALDPTEEH